MAQITTKCPDCHNYVKTEINQTAIDSQLRWYESYRCPFCNNAAEADGAGFPPDNIRQMILADQGTFSLSLNNFDVDRIKAMKIIREIFNLSLSEVSALFKYSADIAIGTKEEMKWVQTILTNQNIDSVINKIA